MGDQQLLFAIALLSLGILAIFTKNFKKDPTDLFNGFLFNGFLLSLSLAIVVAGSLYDNFFLKILFILVVSIYLLIGAFGLVILVIGLFINAHFVLKRERKSFKNLLTLILGIGLVLYSVVAQLSGNIDSKPLNHLLSYCGIMVMYFGLSFYNFILVSFFNNFHKPKLNKDYILVLGSGLIDGYKVSKLLGSRIDRAIEFYRLQKDNHVDSKIIFSGGQGADESIPEGEAMAGYAREKGVAEEDIIVENKSGTTLENFKYSKEIMDREKENYQAVFATSNYHVFRANLYARAAGLNISGLGGKTALYFLPNALIREYIAILAMKKKTYIKRISLITGAYLIFWAAEYFLK